MNNMKMSFFGLLVLCFNISVFAVTSEVVRNKTAEDFAAGDPNNVIVDSQGNITLGRENEVAVKEFDGVWIINTAVVFDSPKKSKKVEPVFLGTSPNGRIYKYFNGELKEVYKSEKLTSQKKTEENDEESKDLDSKAAGEIKSKGNADKEIVVVQAGEQSGNVANPKDGDAVGVNEGEGEKVVEKEHILNEHVFALGFDKDGSLLAGVSGEDCRIIRLSKDTNANAEVLFKPQGACYVFAILKGDDNKIYLATGPGGKIYELDEDCSNPDLVCDLKEKNVLSLAYRDGVLYAGVDEKGIVYKINLQDRSTRVVYDSQQDDITSLLFDDKGNLYAAATTAKAILDASERDSVSIMTKPGRSDMKSPSAECFASSQKVLRLQIANSCRGEKQPQANGNGAKRGNNEGMSVIYKITPEGFVDGIYADSKLFLSMEKEAGNILVGTGNDAEVYSIDIDTEKIVKLYQDKGSTQITALVKTGGELFVGTANRARLVRVGESFSKEGYFDSSTIDAEQPARWGKLQLNADVPDGAAIEVSSRSGNSKEASDEFYSDWSAPVEVDGPVDMNCPVGRFGQYRLKLSGDGKSSPIVREVALAHLVENIAPKISSIETKYANGRGVLNVIISAKDANEDKLNFEMEIRKVGRERWIQIVEDLDKPLYKWDTNTVEDGIYEIRVTADDAISNSPATGKQTVWISDPIVVDNTSPAVEEIELKLKDDTAVLKITVQDELSMIASLFYTVDSNDKWVATLPQDLVYDTKDETFVIMTDELEKGEHIIAVRATDDAENICYKSFTVEVK